MFDPVQLPDLAEFNSETTLVLTVNNRYARRIIAALSASLHKERRVMALPDIIPLAAWLRQAADAMAFEPDTALASYTVDTHASRALWQQAIEEVEQDALLDTALAARLAQEADRLQSDWQLQVDPTEATDDYRHFSEWREAYHRRLQAFDAHDANLATDSVYQWYARPGAELGFSQLVLAGFSEVAPRLQALLAAFQERGVALYRLDLAASQASQVQRVVLPEPDAEWRAAAAWAAQQLQQNPRGRYAIIAPQLESEVPFVHRVLQKALGQVELMEQAGQTGSLEQTEQTAQAEQIGQPVQTGQPEPTVQAGQAAQVGQTRQTAQSRQAGQTEQVGQAGQAGLTEQTQQSEQIGQLGSGPTGQPEQTAQSGQAKQTEQTTDSSALPPHNDTPPGKPPFLYNVAVARPLAEWPVVRAALAWLRLYSRLATQGYCEPELAGAALLAGQCAGAGAEDGARAAIDANLRHQRVVRLALADFTQALADNTPQLHAAWLACLEALPAAPAKATLDAWADWFRQFWQELGFPGPQTLDSTRFQAMEAFERLLLQFAQQAPVFGPVSLGFACGWLVNQAGQTLFQPQADPRARLDVQGFLEAEGGRWDGVWVLGLTADTLPAAVKPNPLIPLSVQRRVGTPRATPERELQWAQNLYQALLCAAPQVVLSSAERSGEQLLHPSPLIASIPAQPGEAFAPQEPDQATPAALERLADQLGPPLPEGERTRGGAGVLEAQARNPLWAFVRYRLGGSELPAYAQLFEQNARGLFLHGCMELIFKQIDSQATLQRLQDEGKLDALCADAIESAATEHLREYSPRLRQLEVDRAHGIVQDWLALELQRPPFTVQGVEHLLEWTWRSLDLRLRIDRLDALETGGLAVIDYKTGASEPAPKADWLRRRPVNLQLPLYAAALASLGAGLEQGEERGKEQRRGQSQAKEPGQEQRQGLGQEQGQNQAYEHLLEHAHFLEQEPGQGQEQSQGQEHPLKQEHFPEQEQVQALIFGHLYAAGAQAIGLADEEQDFSKVGTLSQWNNPVPGWSALIVQWQQYVQQLASEYTAGFAANRFEKKDDLRYCEVSPFLRLNEEAGSMSPPTANLNGDAS